MAQTIMQAANEAVNSSDRNNTQSAMLDLYTQHIDQAVQC